ncbi:MAG TPA: NADH-quinone oxidoreductase subunit H [Oligoflexia bacterium]|nr:NADH-quinone oxidoreductase subunit H [Oligoflexia bacterium]HMP47891.1 NADH-quinone oxidoreductase subunit H [Oligoflexia bacterium]
MENITFLDILIVIIKAAFVMGAVLKLAALNTWVERKGSALIQNRVGANRASILGFDLAGIFNTLVADPVKALFKEDFVPKGVSQFMHSLAPFLGVFPVILSMAVVPFGPPIILESREITMQLVNLNVGILFVFAMGSIAVYGTVLAGWVSRNKFSLFGSLRASAQMISYEITFGLSIIGVLAIYGSLDFNEIIASQTGTILGFIPNWGIFMFFPLNIVAFFIFFTSAMAETKRAPFDLPESESELAAGYFTEYSGMKFLLFWLGEFAEIVVASTLVVLLFFGGWHLPFYDISNLNVVLREISPFSSMPLFITSFITSFLGATIFGAKVAFFCVLQIVIRWTLPRFRYDQLINLCWKIMLPIALINMLLTVSVLVFWG